MRLEQGEPSIITSPIRLMLLGSQNLGRISESCPKVKWRFVGLRVSDFNGVLRWISPTTLQLGARPPTAGTCAIQTSMDQGSGSPTPWPTLIPRSSLCWSPGISALQARSQIWPPPGVPTSPQSHLMINSGLLKFPVGSRHSVLHARGVKSRFLLSESNRTCSQMVATGCLTVGHVLL